MTRKLILTSALALSAAASLPVPAAGECFAESVKSCKEDFPGATDQIIGIRGWCYIIRSALCGLLDD